VGDTARFLSRMGLQEGGKEVALEKLDKQRWHLPASTRDLRLRYRVYGNDLTVRTNHVDASHAQIIPAATFLYLEGQLERPVEVRFEGFPPAWKVASPLPLKGGAFLARNFDTLVDSPFELGAFRSRRFKSEGTTFELAFTGDHNSDEGRITEATQKIVEAAGAIFGGFPFKRYLFLFTFAPKLRGGLEHRDCTSLISDSHGFDKPEGYHALHQLVAHEFFHAWNVKRLRPVELGPFDYETEVHTKSLWIAEGFTDYYGDMLVHRAGLASREEFLESLSSKIEELQTAPGRLVQSVELASFDAWIKYYRPDENSSNTSISYYTKGAVVAFLLDAKIRKQTNNARSLDDVMRAAYQRFADTKGFTAAEFRAVAEQVAGASLASFWDSAISGTAGIARTEIPAASRPYSMTSWPASSWNKRFNRFFT